MKFTEAIAAIQGVEGLENKDEILKAITTRTKEAANLEKQISQMSENLATILEVAGAEGEDFEKKFASATDKIKSLSKASEEATTALEAKEKEITQIKRQSLVQAAATKSKANFEVLNSLLKDEELTVEGDSVTIGGKPAEEYAKEKWGAFVPALFPTQSQTTQTTSDLPNGGAKGKPQTEDAAQKYVESAYSKLATKLKGE